MAFRHIIAVSKPQLLKHTLFHKISSTSKPLYSFCSITDKPPNEENPQHDRDTHYKMISMLCIDQRLDDAKQLLMGMSKKGLDYDEDLFVLLINGYAKSNRKWDVVKNCVKIFMKMEELGVPRTIKSYNPLLDVIIINKKYTMAEKYFDKMLSDGIVPTQHTYTLMISGFCRSSKVETANRYFEDMKSRNLSPDFVVYNIMISGYVQVKKMEEAEKVLVEMKGRGIEPLLVTYNSMINGYVKVRRLGDAEKVVAEMKARNVEPNLITYNTLINGYTLVERMEDAQTAVWEMKGRNVEPDLVTYVTMVKGYVIANRVDDGMKLLEDMKRKTFGRKVDVNLCLGLLKEDCDVEKMSETQRNVLQEVEDYVERVDLLAIRDAARELTELASQRVVDRQGDRMKMDRETRGSDGGSFS
ncbi:pentatricopeptide repeat-containing protein At2g37230 [Helianthus annuus]|uniref:pentatricopeptide repeat-containing protein At2g37230 n=1 Tax=Helianthus annuus TaxID=4232 RepID=UPI000B9074C8|nr:pentatricopeptide repeat-containing protein At2g37230 [Helianthus annuus]